MPGGFSAIYPELAQLETLGIARRGYFVEGLGGAQFALPGAVERLRGAEATTTRRRSCSPRSTRRSRTARRSPWPRRDRSRAGRARVPGAYVVLPRGEPILYLERGGRALQTLVDADDPRLEPALAALVEHVRGGRIKRLALEKVDGEAATRLAARRRRSSRSASKRARAG